MSTFINPGKLVVLTGAESTGKTSLALQEVKEVVDDDGCVLYVDTMLAISSDWLEELGIPISDVSQFALYSCHDLEQVMDAVRAAIQCDVSLVVLDAVNWMTTEKDDYSFIRESDEIEERMIQSLAEVPDVGHEVLDDDGNPLDEEQALDANGNPIPPPELSFEDLGLADLIRDRRQGYNQVLQEHLDALREDLKESETTVLALYGFRSHSSTMQDASFSETPWNGADVRFRSEELYHD